MLDPERMKEGLREQARGFAEAAAGPDPSTRVPTCPEWTLRDLAGHVGQAHRWAAHLIRRGGTEVVDGLPRTIPDAPAAPAPPGRRGGGAGAAPTDRPWSDGAPWGNARGHDR